MAERAHDLDGVVVMVTGASRGLGRALAEAYASAGARLVLCARGEADLEAVVEGLRRGGAEVVAGAVDVTDAAAVGELVALAEERFGRIMVLVNNASALGERAPLRDAPLEDWRRVLAVNLTGVLVVTQAVLPGMRAAGAGSIINVSSGVGNRPRADWGAYGVSKQALEALTWNLALEEESAGIRVNAVDPGSMRTDMRREAYPEEDPATLAPPDARTPVFLWLASDAARITGQRFRARDWAEPTTDGENA